MACKTLREHEAEQTGDDKPHLSHIVVSFYGTHRNVLMLPEIIWLSTAANYIEIHLFLTCCSASNHFVNGIEERLDSNDFIPVHRTAITVG